MRVLNKQQKSLLDIWILHNKNKLTIFTDIENCDFMSEEFYLHFCSINDHETINSNMNRYINDKVSELMVRQK